MQYESIIMRYDPLHKNPNNVRKFQYPLNLLCDVFDLPMHKRDLCDDTFKAIAKHGITQYHRKSFALDKQLTLQF